MVIEESVSEEEGVHGLEHNRREKGRRKSRYLNIFSSRIKSKDF
jgi:uncharacterized protein YceH (UPF0502 family)